MDDAASPLPQLRGPRVFLRAAERSDIETFVRWFNDARVTEFLSFDAPVSGAMEENWFERMVAGQGRDNYHFVMCLRSDGSAFGTIGLHGVDFKQGSAEMGIAIGEPALWSQGLGTEALLALLDLAFGTLRLERVSLRLNPGNARARRSYEKAGFTHEGTQRHALFRQGRFQDVDEMSILSDEWRHADRPRSWEIP